MGYNDSQAQGLDTSGGVVMTRFRRGLLAAFGLLLAGALAQATDLSKIDRSIGKEPAYKHKPGYCLLVFGPKAETRVWLVKDGETLYLDRTGSGDLTQLGARIDRKSGEAIGAIVGRDGKTKYVVRHCNLTRLGDKDQKPFCHVSIDIDGAYRQYSFVGFGDRPQDAPVVHFDGPLTLEVADSNVVLARGEKATDLNVYVVTRGHGERLGSTVLVDYNLGIPEDLKPVVEVEFPAKEPGGKPVRAKYVLKERC
jgi:hypothetical protein